MSVTGSQNTLNPLHSVHASVTSLHSSVQSTAPQCADITDTIESLGNSALGKKEEERLTCMQQFFSLLASPFVLTIKIIVQFVTFVGQLFGWTSAEADSKSLPPINTALIEEPELPDETHPIAPVEPSLTTVSSSENSISLFTQMAEGLEIFAATIVGNLSGSNSFTNFNLELSLGHFAQNFQTLFSTVTSGCRRVGPQTSYGPLSVSDHLVNLPLAHSLSTRVNAVINGERVQGDLGVRLAANQGGYELQFAARLAMGTASSPVSFQMVQPLVMPQLSSPLIGPRIQLQPQRFSQPSLMGPSAPQTHLDLKVGIACQNTVINYIPHPLPFSGIPMEQASTLASCQLLGDSDVRDSDVDVMMGEDAMMFELGMSTSFTGLEDGLGIEEVFLDHTPTRINRVVFERWQGLSTKVEVIKLDGEAKPRMLSSVLIDSDDSAAYSSELDESQASDMLASWSDFAAPIVSPLRDEDAVIDYNGTYNALAILWNSFNTVSYSDWDDSAAVEIVDGKIRLVSEDNQMQNKPFQVLKQIMTKTYGEYLVNTVIGRYQWDKKENLTWGDLKNLLVGVGANLKCSDLRDLFKQIKAQQVYGANRLLCEEYLNPEEIEEIRNVDQFEHLTTSQIKILVDAFRTVPRDGERIPIMEAIYPLLQPKNGKGNFAISHDQVLLYKIEEAKYLNRREPKLSTSEYLAKRLIYQELKDGMVVSLLDNEGNLNYFVVARSLEDKGDAMIASLFMPLSQLYESQQLPLEMHLCFRGTQLNRKSKDALYSLITDIAPQGVGGDVFPGRKDEIIDLLGLLADFRIHHAKLQIHGHSLGGALTQRTVVALVDQLAVELEKLKDIQTPLGAVEEAKRALLKIQCLEAVTWNSPLIEYGLNERLNTTLQFLQTNYPYFSLGIDHGRFKNDVIQELGGSTNAGVLLGYNCKSSNFERRVIWHAHEAVGLANAHGARAYTGPGRLPFNRQVIDNHTPDNALEKNLGNRWYWDENNQTFPAYAAWYAGSAVRWGLSAYQTALYTALRGAHAVTALGKRPATDPTRFN